MLSFSYCHVDSLWPHGLQHTRLPCLSLSPRVCLNSFPLSQWCHPTISFSVAHFFCLWSFLASESFPMCWLFTSGDQSTGATASVSVLPMNIQGWFPLGINGLISLLSKRLSSLLQDHSSKASIFQCSAFFMVQLSYPYFTTGKNLALTIWEDFIFLVSKITVDGNCSHEINRHLHLGKKARQYIKKRDITLLTKVHIVKAMTFSVAM